MAAAFTACALLTMVKVKPGAFSSSILVILFVVIVVGVLSGLSMLGLIALVAGFGAAAQAVTVALAALVLICAWLKVVARLSRGFVAG